MLDTRAGAIDDLVATAVGRAHRDDPVLPSTGGPAGNARLTAWLGLMLLVLFVAECVTLLSLHQLISWHIVLGVVLVPLVIGKTAATGWRILRYYTRERHYVAAGPPPLMLRLLGPLVVLTGLAVLGTGLALIALGSATFTPIVTIGPRSVDALMLHKVAFVLWLVITAAHTLVRLVPALRLAGGQTTREKVAGGLSRGVVMVACTAVGIGAGFAVLAQSGWWTHGSGHHQFFDHERQH